MHHSRVSLIRDQSSFTESLLLSGDLLVPSIDGISLSGDQLDVGVRIGMRRGGGLVNGYEEPPLLRLLESSLLRSTSARADVHAIQVREKRSVH